MESDRASRTAVLMCQGRAAAHGRIAEGRFADPLAMTLLRDDERAVVERVRAGTPPKAWRERIAFDMVRVVGADVAVSRTVAIDDAVRARPAPQVVILGAGLDDRAWRMPELTGVEVFEVDHPATQQDKRSRIADLQPLANVRFVPVDFARDRLDTALASAGHRDEAATTWIWEGVVPYLSRAEVAATVKAVAARSATGSQLIVSYQSPALSAVLGRLVERAIAAIARRSSLLADEPRRSAWTPDQMAELLAGHGYPVSRDDDLLTIAQSLGVPVRIRRSLRAGRIAIAVRSA